MSIIKLTLIICDGCGETYTGGDSKQNTAAEQRIGYKSDDWVYRSPLDFCGGCSEKEGGK